MIAHAEQNAWDEFVLHTLPNRCSEAYKYCDFSMLQQKNLPLAAKPDPALYRELVAAKRLSGAITLVFLDGFFMAALSDMDKLPENACIVSAASDADACCDRAVAARYPFACLNDNLCVDDFMLSIADGCAIAAPLHLLSIAVHSTAFSSHPKRRVTLGRAASMTVLEECIAYTSADYMMNSVTRFHIEQDANLTYHKIQNENTQATHMATTFVQQKKNSTCQFTYFSAGGLFARDDLFVILQETGAQCNTAGFYQLTSDRQYMDHHVDIHHLAAHSASAMLYKGIVDKKSKAVFNGRLYVARGAQKMTAYQANHHLLLSNQAEAYSKPELEIHADDVKCKHGATTGQLDQDALFYLRARGIAEEEAVNMLLHGFAEEIMTRIEHAAFKQRVQTCFGKLTGRGE